MNELTYGDLPVSPEHGVAIHCIFGCIGSYSAHRGDYWHMGASVPVRCSECEAPMMLLRKVTNYIEVTA